MKEVRPLSCYIPKEQQAQPITLIEELVPVVERLGQIFPPDKIWVLFSSTPAATGGKIKFPYCRIDNQVICCRNWVSLLTRYNLSPEKVGEYYHTASWQALTALTWVEVGFQGLENLAVSPASKNWTSAVGHFVNDEERAYGILTGGRTLYRQCLQEFADFRTQHGITSDCFSEYGVEYLLESIK